jgi:hypothetical protein
MCRRAVSGILAAVTGLGWALAVPRPVFAQAPEVSVALEVATSPPVRTLPPSLPEARALTEQPFPRTDPRPARGRPAGRADAAVRSAPADPVSVEVGVNFVGIVGGGFPPDPTGAVGETQYVQAVNSSFAVFDKSGTLLHGPVVISSLWRGVDSPCARNNHGDPVVVYDRLARRWIISQFLLVAQQYGECIAVSATEDATGAYHLYRFPQPVFPDYPKIGVWPDAYYVSYNMFRSSNNAYARGCALEREKMLAGARDARQVCFDTDVFNLLPADLDGTRLPPAGAPNPFIRRNADGRALSIRQFHVDWANPNGSTFGVGATHAPNAVIQVEPFNDACVGNCIPQAGGNPLEGLGERLMFRAAYRRLAGHDALVVNQTIEPTNASRGALRWYEIRNPTASPVLHQQGTFLPDVRSRWMGSIAMDGAGNIAIAYSISGTDMSPGLRVAARAPDAPPGTLGSETLIVDGAAQPGGGRWGDYSQLTIDPVDDCTFWYTGEYISGGRRATRVAAFKVNNCTGGDDPDPPPAGMRIIFTSSRDGNHDIYSMNPDGTDVRRLTTHPAADYAPSVSPDGRTVVFVSERDGGNPEIYVMAADGQNQRRLTNHPAVDDRPVWVPAAVRSAATPPGRQGGRPR